METEAQTLPEKPNGVKRTSIDVAEDIWTEMRIAAIRRQMTIKTAVEAAFRLWISTEKQGRERPRR